MPDQTAREKILQRLRQAPPPAWEVDGEYLTDDWNGFEKPTQLLETFLERLAAVKGTGFAVDGLEAFALKIRALQVEKGWTHIYTPLDSLREFLVAVGVPVLQEVPASGSNWVAITGCESLIAATGSVMVSALSGPGRKIHVSPDTHIVYAGASRLKPFIGDGFLAMGTQRPTSWIGLITGPSRTADIEKTLVLGAHGPKELWVFIDRNC